MMCDNTSEVMSTRKACPSPGVHGFYWGGGIQKHTGPASLTSAIWIPVPRVTQVLTINHMFCINYLIQLVLCSPGPQAHKNTLIRQNIPVAEFISQEPVVDSLENRPFFRICWFQHPKLAELVLSYKTCESISGLLCSF